MAKIPSRRVPSDDCIVYVGRRMDDGKIVDPGTGYAIHEGEWVEVQPVFSIRRYLALRKLMEGVQNDKGLEMALDNLCHELAERVTAWTWTDMLGKALPDPYHNPAVFHDLTEDEILWLALASQGESPGERKNASAPSGPS